MEYKTGNAALAVSIVVVVVVIMRSLFPIVVFLILGRVSAESSDGKEAIWKGFSMSCNNNDEAGQVVGNASVSCHGIRLVRKIVQKLLEDARKRKSFEFFNGISLMEKEDVEQSSRNGRFLKDYGPMGTIVKWLEGRELRIKLPTLLPVNLENAIEQSLPSSDEEKGRGGGGGGGGGFGGGGKKGDGGVMLMALMMGKMMAAMGFGALALLAMKALMVSALALMLSLIVAAKKLSGGKEEDSHHVVYAQEVHHGHHRRRRSLEDDNNYPYRGYMILPTDSTKVIE